MDVSMMCSDSLNVTSLGSGAVKAQWTIAFTLSSSYEYLLSCAMAWYFCGKGNDYTEYFSPQLVHNKKKIAIFVKKKMLTKMVALLCILLFIMAITGIICLIGKINGWHSPIADKM